MTSTTTIKLVENGLHLPQLPNEGKRIYLENNRIFVPERTSPGNIWIRITWQT